MSATAFDVKAGATTHWKMFNLSFFSFALKILFIYKRACILKLSI